MDDLDLDVDYRRTRLMKGWGSHCCCTRCENELQLLKREKEEDEKIIG